MEFHIISPSSKALILGLPASGTSVSLLSISLHASSKQKSLNQHATPDWIIMQHIHNATSKTDWIIILHHYYACLTTNWNIMLYIKLLCLFLKMIYPSAAATSTNNTASWTHFISLLLTTEWSREVWTDRGGRVPYKPRNTAAGSDHCLVLITGP